MIILRTNTDNNNNNSHRSVFIINLYFIQYIKAILPCPYFFILSGHLSVSAERYEGRTYIVSTCLRVYMRNVRGNNGHPSLSIFVRGCLYTLSPDAGSC